MDKAGELKIDGDLVRALAQLLHETGLTEIEYAAGDHRIRVARTAPGAAAVTVAVPGPVAAAAHPEPISALADSPGAVKAPMVGTAYLAPEPGAPPFVTVGGTVRQGDVVLIIEAMKVMNQIHAPTGGRVAQLLIADGTPVEYGQLLMVIE
jgi:acetyl-CoA carboxylase biotin carboxyl carrier protein